MKKLIIANWKMNGNINMLKTYLQELHQKPIIVALPDIYLALADEILKTYSNTKMVLATQNIGTECGYGAYTSQISGEMLHNAGAKFVIIGHSEIRAQLHTIFSNIDKKDYLLMQHRYFSKQLQNAINGGLCPIFCIGEHMDQRINCSYIDFLMMQLSTISNINNLDEIVIAYEPCWAIGSGVTPTLAQIEEVATAIKTYMNSKMPNTKYKITYGGSVNVENIQDIINTNNIDGVLIGGASLQVDKFKQIIELSV